MWTAAHVQLNSITPSWMFLRYLEESSTPSAALHSTCMCGSWYSYEYHESHMHTSRVMSQYLS